MLEVFILIVLVFFFSRSLILGGRRGEVYVFQGGLGDSRVGLSWRICRVVVYIMLYCGVRVEFIYIFRDYVGVVDVVIFQSRGKERIGILVIIFFDVSFICRLGMSEDREFFLGFLRFILRIQEVGFLGLGGYASRLGGVLVFVRIWVNFFKKVENIYRFEVEM